MLFCVASLQDRPQRQEYLDRRPEPARLYRPPETKENREYLNIPFREKNEAKELVGNAIRWDGAEKAWFVDKNNSEALEKLDKWRIRQPFQEADHAPAPVQPGQNQPRSQQLEANVEREYLSIPFKEKNEAKEIRDSNGRQAIHWDGEKKGWWVDKNETAALEQLEKWRVREDKENTAAEPSLTPRDELAQTLENIGARPEALREHPIMDGAPHRIEEQNDKPGEKSVFYVAHGDGRPAGFVQNNRTGEEQKWISKGHTLTEEQMAEVKAEASQKLVARTKAEMRKYAETAAELTKQFKNMKYPEATPPYLEAKGIQIHPGIKVAGKTTCVPGHDVDGNIKALFNFCWS